MDDQTTAARPFETGPFAEGSSKPFGGAATEEQRYGNNPPLEERILMDFDEDVQREGIAARIAELLASTTRAPTECNDETVAGRIGDLCKQAHAVSNKLDDARERHNRQLIDARTSLKTRADGLIEPLNKAVNNLRKLLDDWTAREDAKRREAQRLADEQARAAEEAARKVREEQEAAARTAGISEKEIARTPEPVFEAPRVAPAPIARGDYGSSVGSRQEWKHKIESVRQLPDRYLKHPKVIEALDKVIAAEIRTNKVREIKGVRIWAVTKAVVR